jgi:hypothetical protein
VIDDRILFGLLFLAFVGVDSVVTRRAGGSAKAQALGALVLIAAFALGVILDNPLSTPIVSAIFATSVIWRRRWIDFVDGSPVRQAFRGYRRIYAAAEREWAASDTSEREQAHREVLVELEALEHRKHPKTRRLVELLRTYYESRNNSDEQPGRTSLILAELDAEMVRLWGPRRRKRSH